MTDIERYQDQLPTTVLTSQDQAVRRLTEWAASAEAALHVAAQLVKTSFVPESFRGKPHEATAAILAGLEIGLSPMSSLRSFDVISGQAAPRAITLRAVAQAHGHEIVLDESTATRCKIRGRRAGSNEWQSVTWTLDRARSLNLTNRPNWKSQPQAMLVARATSEIARLIASDAILGIAYSSEEIADGAGAGVEVPAVTTVNDNAQSTPGTRKMSRARRPEPTPPDPDDVVEAEVIDDDAVTDAQIKKMATVFGKVDIKDRKDRIDYISMTIGREVTSSKECTKEEASMVIDALEVLQHQIDDEAPTIDDELDLGVES